MGNLRHRNFKQVTQMGGEAGIILKYLSMDKSMQHSVEGGEEFQRKFTTTFLLRIGATISYLTNLTVATVGGAGRESTCNFFVLFEEN